MMRCRSSGGCGGLWWIFFSRYTGNVSGQFEEVEHGTSRVFSMTFFQNDIFPHRVEKKIHQIHHY
jgi:hypothetical protein